VEHGSQDRSGDTDALVKLENCRTQLNLMMVLSGGGASLFCNWASYEQTTDWVAMVSAGKSAGS
jgi:hypothetical protein